MTILKRAIVCGSVVFALSACEHGDPVSAAGGQLGQSALINANDGNALAASLPSGSATVTTAFGGFTTGIQDAFGRRPADTTAARRTRFFTAFEVGGFGKFWEFPYDVSRNASPELLDPRVPVPQSTTAKIRPATAVMELYQPGSPYPGDDYWEFYSRFSGLDPATVYNVAFVHRRLTVAGELDHVQRILTGAVTQPDTLKLLPGTAGAINTNWTNSAPAGCAAFPGPKTNPFTVATFTTSATGTPGATSGPTLDKCWLAGNGIWTKANFDKQPMSMVGRSDDVTYTLPNYNYVELWKGAVETGQLQMRVQIAQDLSPSGKPIANAYPPFPAPNSVLWTGHPNLYATDYGDKPPSAVDAAPAYPISASLTATLPGAVGVPTSVVATLTNLQRLDAPFYKAFFVNPRTGVAAPAVGTYVRTVGGTQVENVSSTSTFKGGPGTITFTAAYNPSVHGAYSDSLTFLVITKETDPGAATPSNSQPLWVKIFKVPPKEAGGAFTFGTFRRDADSLALDSTRAAVRFVPQGVATGGVIGDTVTMTVKIGGADSTGPVFVGSIVELRFAGLQRPPKGYEYAAFLRKKADGTLVYIGGLRAPDGSSVSNADIAPVGGNYGPNGIKVALLKWDAHNIPGATLCSYDKIQIYVVPKGGVANEPLAMVFNIGMPKRVLEDAIACK